MNFNCAQFWRNLKLGRDPILTDFDLTNISTRQKVYTIYVLTTRLPTNIIL